LDQIIKVVLDTSKVYLDCTVNAAPLPDVNWTDENDQPIQESYKKITVRQFAMTMQITKRSVVDSEKSHFDD